MSNVEDLGHGITYKGDVDPTPTREILGLEDGSGVQLPNVEIERLLSFLNRHGHLSEEDMKKFKAFRARGSSFPTHGQVLFTEVEGVEGVFVCPYPPETHPREGGHLHDKAPGSRSGRKRR